MKLKKSVIIQNFGDSYGMYDIAASVMHELNESGYVIVDSLSKKLSVAQIVVVYAHHFDISSDQARADVNQFLKKLTSMDLLA